MAKHTELQPFTLLYIGSTQFGEHIEGMAKFVIDNSLGPNKRLERPYEVLRASVLKDTPATLWRASPNTVMPTAIKGSFQVLVNSQDLPDIKAARTKLIAHYRQFWEAERDYAIERLKLITD